MVAWRQQHSTAIEDFQSSVQDLHSTAHHLREIEADMAAALRRMREEGHPRERLLVADLMLTNLHSLVDYMAETGCLRDAPAPGRLPSLV